MGTEVFSHLNWLAVLVAAVAYFMLGALWYSKALFANTWIKTTGVNVNDPNAKKGVAAVMVMTLILEFITCIALAVIVERLGLSSAMSGLKLGLFTGICFSAVAVCISYMYQSKPKVLSAIDSGYHIVGNIIAAIILCVWP
jgi:hypothetical protein